MTPSFSNKAGYHRNDRPPGRNYSSRVTKNSFFPRAFPWRPLPPIPSFWMLMLTPSELFPYRDFEQKYADFRGQTCTFTLKNNEDKEPAFTSSQISWVPKLHRCFGVLSRHIHSKPTTPPLPKMFRNYQTLARFAWTWTSGIPKTRDHVASFVTDGWFAKDWETRARCEQKDGNVIDFRRSSSVHALDHPPQILILLMGWEAFSLQWRKEMGSCRAGSWVHISLQPHGHQWWYPLWLAWVSLLVGWWWGAHVLYATWASIDSTMWQGIVSPCVCFFRCFQFSFFQIPFWHFLI